MSENQHSELKKLARGPVYTHQTARRHQVRHILVGQWIPQIHPNRTQDDLCGKPVVLERLFARHVEVLSSTTSRQDGR